MSTFCEILSIERYSSLKRGESATSYADYAIAMVGETEFGDHVQQRISVVRK